MIAEARAQPARAHLGGQAKPGAVAEDELRCSPYLCAWCRNGWSLNEAHENCLEGRKFDRFWPVENVALGDVPPFPVRELAAGKLSPQETRVIVYFYLWLMCNDLGKGTEILRGIPDLRQGNDDG